MQERLRQHRLDLLHGEDVVLAREIPEESPQRDEPLLLGREGEWLAAFLAIVVEIAPVALQDRPGDLLRGADAALIGPADEPPHAIRPELCRARGVAARGEPLQEPYEVGVQAALLDRIALPHEA